MTVKDFARISHPMRRVLSSLAIAAAFVLAGHEIALSQSAPLAVGVCNFDTCKRLRLANELGIGFQVIVAMQGLRLAVPPWMYSTLEPGANDLNLGFNLQQLVSSTNVLVPPADQIQQRLSIVYSSNEGMAFALGTLITESLFNSVAVATGKGTLVGLATEAAFVRKWNSTGLTINDTLEQLQLSDLKVDRELGTSSAIQEQLCRLKSQLNQKWELRGFLCAQMTDNIRSILEQASALESVKSVQGRAGGGAKPGALGIEVVPSARTLIFKVRGQAVDGIDIWDFQDKRPVTPDDITIGTTTTAVRLGRDNDMAVIGAFRQEGDKICTRYLYLPLRNGDNIEISRVSVDTPDLELYSIRYNAGVAVAGIRYSDFEFVWDPASQGDPANWHLGPPVLPAGVQAGRCTQVGAYAQTR